VSPQHHRRERKSRDGEVDMVKKKHEVIKRGPRESSYSIAGKRGGKVVTRGPNERCLSRKKWGEGMRNTLSGKREGVV